MPPQVLLVGDSGVGKTCLVMRFISDRFEDHLPATVGEQQLLLPATACCSAHGCGGNAWPVAGRCSRHRSLKKENLQQR
jgi:hypothetical protein